MVVQFFVVLFLYPETKNMRWLVAALYGPCRVQTRIDGVDVTVEEETLYPFGNTVQITVRPEREHEFPLYFRNPQ